MWRRLFSSLTEFVSFLLLMHLCNFRTNFLLFHNGSQGPFNDDIDGSGTWWTEFTTTIKIIEQHRIHLNLDFVLRKNIARLSSITINTFTLSCLITAHEKTNDTFICSTLILPIFEMKFPSTFILNENNATFHFLTGVVSRDNQCWNWSDLRGGTTVSSARLMI